MFPAGRMRLVDRDRRVSEENVAGREHIMRSAIKEILEINKKTPLIPSAMHWVEINDAIEKNNALIKEKNILQDKLNKLHEIEIVIPPERAMGPFIDESQAQISVRIATGPLSDEAAKIQARIAEIEKMGLTLKVPVEIPKEALEGFEIKIDTNVVKSVEAFISANDKLAVSEIKLIDAYAERNSKLAEYASILAEKREAITKSEIKVEGIVKSKMEPIEINFRMSSLMGKEEPEILTEELVKKFKEELKNNVGFEEYLATSDKEKLRIVEMMWERTQEEIRTYIFEQTMLNQ